MKKNFLKVAALLIAAMLMVVSCTQEVAPKNESNEPIDASFSVGFGRDIKINNVDGTNITYVYSLEPQWTTLKEGSAVYGSVTDKKIDTTYGIADRVSDVNIGYVTPGLWKVTVNGYEGYKSDSQKGTLVLTGEATTYFNKDKKTVTVLVYPSQEGTSKVNITVEMQDLGANNEIKFEFSNLSGTSIGEITLKKDESNVTVTPVSGKAAYEYKIQNFGLSGAGYITVKVTVPNYKGGYVRTFLATPGDAINITGSVYPSEFIDSKMNILSLSVDNATISVSGTNTTKGNIYFNSANALTFTLNDAKNTYLTDDEITALKANDDVDNVVGTKKYEWYINSEKVTKAYASSEATEETSIADNAKSVVKKISAPGVYSVSCKVIYEVAITYKGQSSAETKTFVGDAYATEFIVENVVENV